MSVMPLRKSEEKILAVLKNHQGSAIEKEISITDFCRLTKLSRRMVFYAMQRLEELGLIEITKTPGKVNRVKCCSDETIPGASANPLTDNDCTPGSCTSCCDIATCPSTDCTSGENGTANQGGFPLSDPPGKGNPNPLPLYTRTPGTSTPLKQDNLFKQGGLVTKGDNPTCKSTSSKTPPLKRVTRFEREITSLDKLTCLGVVEEDLFKQGCLIQAVPTYSSEGDGWFKRLLVRLGIPSQKLNPIWPAPKKSSEKFPDLFPSRASPS